MVYTRNVSDSVVWVGGSDRRLALFENLFPIPRGVSYNSYVILDEKTALLDTADSSITLQFLENVRATLGDRPLDYLIVNHMEPDHCATIETLLPYYPNLKIVGNAKTFQMMRQFFDFDVDSRALVVKEGDALELGQHTLRFYTAPMVHWPEVMVSYEESEKILFSADAFGTFGAVDGGLFYGGGIHFFLIQCLGVAATAVWAAVTITIVFLILKHTIGLRVSVEEELKGLDITEHGLPSAYAGFAFAYDDTPDDLAEAPAVPVSPAAAVPMDAAVVVETAPGAAKDTTPGKKMTRVDILCKMERFDALKRAMFDIGITGMTAANVMGCGEQRGKTEGYFRGAKVEASMLPSIQVSIVVCKVPVSLVVETARKVLYTGRIGDGKIFVSDVENVIKVRTGEQGYDALQDEAL